MHMKSNIWSTTGVFTGCVQIVGYSALGEDFRPSHLATLAADLQEGRQATRQHEPLAWPACCAASCLYQSAFTRPKLKAYS